MSQMVPPNSSLDDFLSDRTSKEPVFTLNLLSEGQRQPERYRVSLDFARLAVRAARINHFYEPDFDLSFSSMLLAFLASDDPLSLWFQEFVETSGADQAALLRARNLQPDLLKQVRGEPVPDDELEKPRMLTASMGALLQAAGEYQRLAGQPPAQTEAASGSAPVPDPVLNSLLRPFHLMGGYIYKPAGHERDLEHFKLDRRAWSNSFLGWIAWQYPSEQAFWSEQHVQVFREPPVIERRGEPPGGPTSPAPDGGPSTHIATDLWTIQDSLGYDTYAYAIYRFLTHEKTKPPLTISIQAPWGGGKTSLMRMIQHYLDPHAFSVVKGEERQAQGALSMQEAQEAVDEWIRDPAKGTLPSIPASSKRLTIWFNAWKYESANQVWAGLVDTIMHQVAARLNLADRERFWLLLNLKRVDADQIRSRIHEHILRYWVRKLTGWGIGLALFLVTSLAATVAGSLGRQTTLETGGLVGMGLSTGVGALLGWVKYLEARQEAQAEPAAVSLREYLEIPDYSKELGFIHYVTADLKRVLESIPKDLLPLVIFIDDLDRCSPAKVAEVVEAVNLFLAGEFPNCIFVLGMDSEMVAAALQAAHNDLISNLPVDVGIPIGWRFMDKFVQLPFIIPPARVDDLSSYTSSLLTPEERLVNSPGVIQGIQELERRLPQFDQISAEVSRYQQEHGLDEQEAGQLKKQIETRVVQETINAGVHTFNDRNPEVQRVLQAAGEYFQGNPRELKRFVNAYRFHYFLLWAHKARGQPGPSPEQTMRWTVLSMRWPEVVRWLRRGGGSDWCMNASGDTLVETKRLARLEELCGKAKDLSDWQTAAEKQLGLSSDTTPWLRDDDLFKFLKDENTRFEAGQRLSDGAGKGLW